MFHDRRKRILLLSTILIAALLALLVISLVKAHKATKVTPGCTNTALDHGGNGSVLSC